MFKILHALQDNVEVVLLKCLWSFVFLCAIGFNLFVSITGFRPGAQPSSETNSSDELSSWLKNKYNLTAWFYDFCDMPWERIYRQLRPLFVGDIIGDCLELGVRITSL